MTEHILFQLVANASFLISVFFFSLSFSPNLHISFYFNFISLKIFILVNNNTGFVVAALCVLCNIIICDCHFC